MLPAPMFTAGRKQAMVMRVIAAARAMEDFWGKFICGWRISPSSAGEFQSILESMPEITPSLINDLRGRTG
ncbi:MAG TPA: hypothetical protein VGQ99_12400, partial [Tepidisphaeraceae bacterium]|nr:hypothetical protein [Tepidisphaeraceae bacterium]